MYNERSIYLLYQHNVISMWVPPQVVDKPLSIRCQYHSVLVSTLVPTLSNYEQCKSRDLPVDASSVKIFRFFEKINFVQITTSSKNIFEQFFVNFILKNVEIFAWVVNTREQKKVWKGDFGTEKLRPKGKL